MSVLGMTLFSDTEGDLLDQIDLAEDILVLAQLDAGR